MFSTKTPKVAVAQLSSTSDKLRNIFHVAHCSRLAKIAEASVLCLPECFAYIGQESVKHAEPPISLSGDTETKDEAEATVGSNSLNNNEKVLCNALKSIINSSADFNHTEELDIFLRETKEKFPISDKDDNNSEWTVLSALETIAKESGLWISAGGLHEIAVDTNDEKKVYNTHLILNPEGHIVSKYNKIHLFDVSSIPSSSDIKKGDKKSSNGERKINLSESRTTKPGNKLVVCSGTPIGNLGLSICYDLRFPEVYIGLTQHPETPAQILLVPSAFTVPTGKAHWHTLLQARAIENQCYVIAPAQYGRHNEKRESYGHSLVIDPWGKILIDAGGYDSQKSTEVIKNSIIVCEIDLKLLEVISQRMPIQEHRKKAEFSF